LVPEDELRAAASTSWPRSAASKVGDDGHGRLIRDGLERLAEPLRDSGNGLSEKRSKLCGDLLDISGQDGEAAVAHAIRDVDGVVGDQLVVVAVDGEDGDGDVRQGGPDVDVATHALAAPLGELGARVLPVDFDLAEP
jgi:hypothetical protein